MIDLNENTILEDQFKSYEVDILKRWVTFGTYVELGGVSPKANWIKGRLLEVGEDYPYRMWQGYKDFCERAAGLRIGKRKRGVIIHSGSYTSFLSYLYVLRKLGLIGFSRKRVKTKGFSKNFMRLVKERLDDPAWQRPYQVAYPKTDWKRKTSKEKELIREKAKKPSAKRGRPRKHPIK